MKVTLRIFLLIFTLMIVGSSIAEIPKNHRELSREFWTTWGNDRVTFYCDCKFDKQKVVNYSSCSYKPSHARKDHRAQIEHIMPAQQFGQHFSCWRDNPCKKAGKKMSSRQCCMKIDTKFRMAHNDMHNLVPIIGELNQHRGSIRFDELSISEKKKIGGFHGCEFYLDKSARKVEPKDDKKGVVARANLYMSDAYQIQLNARQRKMFERWDQSYPPTHAEHMWHERIRNIQGTENKYISNHL